jgi:predicted MPP superfamily phosphohydrolase
MILFILSFFTLYGGVHAYAFFKARGALGFGWGPGLGLAVFMLAMTVAPVLIRLLERYEYELAARALSYIAYLWMAALFLFFCGALVFDVLNLALRAVGWLAQTEITRIAIPVKFSFPASLALSLIISVYGYFDALNIRTERLTIETPKLPAGIEKLTIAQISDVHLGLIIRCRRLDLILDKVKAANPDILVSTGDLVDGQINRMPGLAERLQAVKPKYGKYAITGNHEYYAGLDKALAFTREAGFTLLQGESISNGVITIAGVNDPTGVQMKIEQPVSEKDLLSKLPKDRFTLFLKHRPVIDKESAGLFDLQLSGHTHKGQIWPFTYLSAISYPMNDGRYDLAKGSILYVSRGSGTWGPPIRFLSHPQITVVELVRTTAR